jgi:putative addiction module killer protein
MTRSDIAGLLEAMLLRWSPALSLLLLLGLLVAWLAASKLEQGNFSNVKGVGAGVYEYRIDFGPGYRIYFGKDGDRLVILLAGGTKKRQDADIAAAKGHWRDYKRRKRQEV